MFKLLAVLLLAATLSITGTACGGDDDSSDGVTPSSPNAESTGGGSAATAAPQSGSNDSQSGSQSSSGAGQATLTVGDQSWSFDGIYCAFGPEETQNKRVSFSSGAFGEVDGSRVQLDASIQDTQEQGRYEGDGVIYSVSLNDVQNFQDPSIGWSSISGLGGGSATSFKINDKRVTVQTTFDNELTDELENVDGTLDMTCP